MTWLRVVFLGAVALVFSTPESAPADPIPNPKTHHEATVVTASDILVFVDFACQEGTDTNIAVGANQPTVGVPDTNGFGSTSLEATGKRQTAEVLVHSFQGVWRIGDASVTLPSAVARGHSGEIAPRS
jgi:hypothetical protein